MSRPVAPIVCDGPGCTNRKQESNRWCTIYGWFTTPVGLGAPAHLQQLMIVPGTSTEPNEDGSTLYDFCGQTCALKWVSEQMSKVTS